MSLRRKMSCCIYLLNYLELRRTTIQSIKFSEVVQRNIRVHCALCYCPLEKYTVCGRTPFVYVALLGRHVVIHKLKGEAEYLCFFSLHHYSLLHTALHYLTCILTLIHFASLLLRARTYRHRNSLSPSS
ncbi:hypothetical protein C8R48DRAFT_719698 [Suillus tomentosus]|nr:hypothetical protein C8R48DRAFT_719698 [Suillus tomentosus]